MTENVEWVETTARTVEEAVDQALDQLGVDEQEAEYEVLEEPRPGLFGRVRGQARVRARIRPKSQPPKQDRRDRRRSKAKAGAERSEASSGASTTTLDDEETVVPTEEPVTSVPEEQEAGGRNRRRRERAGGEGDEPRPTKERTVTNTADASVDEVAEQVEAFLTGLVTAFGESAPVVVDTSDDEVVGRVDAKLGLLIGRKGQTLDAIQELTRVTAQRSAPSDIRIKVDVGDYRLQRQAALERFAREVAGRVRESGKSVALEPMPSPDRKIVHDALADEAGVITSSDGAEPRRRVVIAPADGA